MTNLKKNINYRALLKALLVAPLSLIPAILLVVGIQLLFANQSSADEIPAIFGGAFILSLVTLLYAYLVTFLYGLPAMLLLIYYQRFQLPLLLLTSIIPAIVLYLLLQPSVIFIALFSFFSIMIAFCCWWFYKSSAEKENPS